MVRDRDRTVGASVLWGIDWERDWGLTIVIAKVKQNIEDHFHFHLLGFNEEFIFDWLTIVTIVAEITNIL